MRNKSPHLGDHWIFLETALLQFDRPGTIEFLRRALLQQFVGKIEMHALATGRVGDGTRRFSCSHKGRAARNNTTMKQVAAIDEEAALAPAEKASLNHVRVRAGRA
ncbi:hypothetical protein C7451_1073 [Blastomonas natatoria]|uniref:Uncharacterized protein n=1 Tax=Blastomonas natatoria TaxID=34015 RepID=A0A2V3UZV4_9SPHN|nr:hypothetical protein C7451_1073 [Blastomonas natatoria]